MTPSFDNKPAKNAKNDKYNQLRNKNDWERQINILPLTKFYASWDDYSKVFSRLG